MTTTIKKQKEYPWTFLSLDHFDEERNTGKLQGIEFTSELSSLSVETIVYHLKNKYIGKIDCPFEVQFNSDTGLPCSEHWGLLGEYQQFIYHRIDKPAKITTNECQYFFYGLQHDESFKNGLSFHFGYPHGDVFSNLYYGLEVVPENHFKGKTKEYKLNASKKLTLALASPEEVEDLKIHFQQYETKKRSEFKPNKIPINSIEQMIVWLKDNRPDLHFTSDSAAAEMLKDTALKVFHDISNDELKVLKTYGLIPMFWYRANVNANEKVYNEQSLVSLGVHPLFKKEIVEWLDRENLARSRESIYRKQNILKGYEI